MNSAITVQANQCHMPPREVKIKVNENKVQSLIVELAEGCLTPVACSPFVKRKD